MTSSTAQTPGRPLISATSILILSAFLVAAPLAELATEELSPLIVGCGLVGLLAYIGLQIAAERREHQGRVDGQNRAHNRLHKHLATPLIPPLSLDFDGDPLAELLAARGGTPPAQPSLSARSRTN